MALSGQQTAKLREAVLDVVTDEADLARVVHDGLDVRLADITRPASLTDVVTSLIAWLDTRGLVVRFVETLCRERPASHPMKTILVELASAAAPHAASGTASRGLAVAIADLSSQELVALAQHVDELVSLAARGKLPAATSIQLPNRSVGAQLQGTAFDRTGQVRSVANSLELVEAHESQIDFFRRQKMTAMGGQVDYDRLIREQQKLLGQVLDELRRRLTPFFSALWEQSTA